MNDAIQFIQHLIMNDAIQIILVNCKESNSRKFGCMDCGYWPYELGSRAAKV